MDGGGELCYRITVCRSAAYPCNAVQFSPIHQTRLVELYKCCVELSSYLVRHQELDLLVRYHPQCRYHMAEFYVARVFHQSESENREIWENKVIEWHIY